jgi:hypothetical protein
MKRLLIMEIEPGKQCPCWIEPYEVVVSVCPGNINLMKGGSKSCLKCSLPKIKGTTKRLLIMEVEPTYCHGSMRCLYRAYYKVCGHPECKDKVSGSYPRKCCMQNCPLPTLNPDKEGET